MCGEHEARRQRVSHAGGSSPHVRGARIAFGLAKFPTGIIPACAGSTRTLTVIGVFARDHPRMCGEHLPDTLTTSTPKGSSPHVRGALLRSQLCLSVGGIIPACAGSTLNRLTANISIRDHPRMCGEHFATPEPIVLSWGSSPHVRGARRTCCQTKLSCGIIPACAGSTRFCAADSWRNRDHPRMCGEHICLFCCFLYVWDHPRMCGEHVGPDHRTSAHPGSSPHVRGARHGCTRQAHPARIIPACAGSTHAMRSAPRFSRDHPRMCGEHKHGG